ncbi:MAG: molybdopterin-dependent oxidoreductase [Syntrophomonadaceae bacterium]|nr:molybdopterin-dependent oxidoreductase [Syntrophomonadaceae bacterium]
MEVKKSVICGVCPGACVVDVQVENGKLVDIFPAKDEPFGALCLRGGFAKEILYSSDRLKKPLIRTGKKGEGEFREATWDEALDYVAEGFLKIKNKYGAEALMSHMGRGGFEQGTTDFMGISDPRNHAIPGFFAPLGSPNASGVGSICYNSIAIFAPMTTVGLYGTNILPDIANADHIVVWGTNPITNSPPFQFQAIRKAKQRGAKITAIDHYVTDICKRADDYYLVRSGTDGALALGVLKVIIDEKLYDKDFVDNWVLGFAELEEYVNTKTLEEWASIACLEADDIINLATSLARQEKTTLLMYTGLEYSNSGVQAIRAIYTIWALLGKLDQLGGLLLDAEANQERLKKIECAKAEKKPIGTREYPMFTELTRTAQFIKFPQAVLENDPYPIKGLLNIGSSIITSYPNASKFAAALAKLEFLVVIDRYFTEDCKYADVILPASTYFEIESYVLHGASIKRRERVVEPLGEARQDIFIIHDIAKRLGYGENYPKDQAELIERGLGSKELAEQLSREGSVIRPMPARVYKKYEKGGIRKDGKAGFPTPSGKFEVKSSYLEEYGYPGLPEYIEPIESPISQPDLAKNYPLILNTGTRIQTTFRSQFLNIEGLLKIQPDPLVLINIDDAAKRGIEDGDRVWVKTIRDKVEFVAKVTKGMPLGEIELNMGGGSAYQAKSWAQANANRLTDDNNCDYISGFPVIKALLCEVEKI